MSSQAIWANYLDRAASFLDKLLLAVGCLAAIFVLFYIAAAILGSWFVFEVPDELLFVAEAMIFIVFLPQAMVVAQKSHVAVDVLARRFPASVDRPLDYFAALFGLFFYGMLAWGGWEALTESLDYGAYHLSVLSIPEWITRFVFVFGVGVALFRQLLELILIAFKAKE